jgi:hypothetical protein
MPLSKREQQSGEPHFIGRIYPNDVKESGTIGIEENRTKLFLETVSLANVMMTLPYTIFLKM